MQYCKNCQRLVDGEVCPHCRNKKLRVALDADFCLIAEIPYMQAEMLKEVYADNDIPCTERSVLGAGITSRLGVNVERVRLYVPYDRFEPAQELYRAFFEGAAEPIEDEADAMQETCDAPAAPEPADDAE